MIKITGGKMDYSINFDWEIGHSLGGKLDAYHITYIRINKRQNKCYKGLETMSSVKLEEDIHII